MNDINETIREIRGLCRELEAKLEGIALAAESDDACELIEEADQNVISILNSLQVDLSAIHINRL